MRILLDECVPWQTHELLDDHEYTTAQKRGWGGVTNGELLKLAEAEFDLLITSDQNIRCQQNLAGRKFAILSLSTNDLRRLVAAEALVKAIVDAMAAGEFRHLEIP